MIRKIFRMLLLKDIISALIVGISCCFKKPVTKKLSDIKRVEKFRDGFVVDKKKCVKCGICQGICPNGSIKLEGTGIPVFNFDKCCYCGLCQKACPRLAIKAHSIRIINSSRKA